MTLDEEEFAEILKVMEDDQVSIPPPKAPTFFLCVNPFTKDSFYSLASAAVESLEVCQFEEVYVETFPSVHSMSLGGVGFALSPRIATAHDDQASDMLRLLEIQIKM